MRLLRLRRQLRSQGAERRPRRNRECRRGWWTQPACPPWTRWLRIQPQRQRQDRAAGRPRRCCCRKGWANRWADRRPATRAAVSTPTCRTRCCVSRRTRRTSGEGRAERHGRWIQKAGMSMRTTRPRWLAVPVSTVSRDHGAWCWSEWSFLRRV